MSLEKLKSSKIKGFSKKPFFNYHYHSSNPIEKISRMLILIKVENNFQKHLNFLHKNPILHI